MIETTILVYLWGLLGYACISLFVSGYTGNINYKTIINETITWPAQLIIASGLLVKVLIDALKTRKEINEK